MNQTKHDFNHGIATVIYHPVSVSFIKLSKGSAFVNYHLKQSEVDLTEPLIWGSYIQSTDGDPHSGHASAAEFWIGLCVVHGNCRREWESLHWANCGFWEAGALGWPALSAHGGLLRLKSQGCAFGLLGKRDGALSLNLPQTPHGTTGRFLVSNVRGWVGGGLTMWWP